MAYTLLMRKVDIFSKHPLNHSSSEGAMKRFVAVLCLTCCSLFLSWPVLAVPITFDFSTNEITNGSHPALYIQTMGLNVQVSASEDPHQTPLLVHKYTGGLGVDSGSGDSKMVDNSGPDELLHFLFAKEVRLLQVIFSYVDSGDEYRLLVDGSLLLSEAIPSLVVNYAANGSRFAFGATDSNDDYRIQQFTVDDLSAAPVPEPSTWILLLVGLAVLAGRRGFR